MGRTPAVSSRLLHWLVLVAWLSACQSPPVTDVSLPPTSSLLALDVVFPAPLSRDPSLVQVYFVKGAIHAGMDELPEFIPASFVKWDRAYLLDPEPGTYSVVAVAAAYAPPLNDYRIAGVDKTTWSHTSSDAMIFPAELIQRTQTAVAPGRVAYMGALRIRRGDRIDAKTELQDGLQRRIAERLRPGVTSESGLAGWLKRTRGVNLEETSLSHQAGDRESFLDEAMGDFEGSPWLRVIARAAPQEATPASSIERAPVPTRMVPIPESVSVTPQSAGPEPAAVTVVPQLAVPEPETVAAPPQSTVAEPEFATAMPQSAALAPEFATLDPQTPTPIAEASPPSPERRRFPGVPPGSPLSEIEFGMSHRDVHKIAGAPDGRIDRLTAKAWIPFYNGPGANLRDWIYEGRGRVVFSLHGGSLTVIDVVYEPAAKK